MMGGAGYARLKYGPSVNIVYDGNSLFANNPTGPITDLMPAHLIARDPEFAACSYSNVAISGQTWANMRDSPGDVDGAWVAGKTNVLVIWETTNSVYNSGLTAAQTLSDAKDYITARKALRSWKVVLLTSLPRAQAPDQATRQARNLTLEAVDNAMRAQFRDMGVDVLVDTRLPGSPFVLPDYTVPSWAISPIWADPEPADQKTHLNGAGKRIITEMVIQGLRRVPA